MPIIGSVIRNAISIRSKLPKDVILKFDARKAQEKILKKLLKKAQFTKFGEKYGFSDILMLDDIISEFQNRVPLYDYQKLYNDWWYRSLNNESFVTWPGKTKYFALSSGTSGSSSKHIPVTSDMLRAIKRTSIKQLFSVANYDLPREFFDRGILMLGGSTHLQYNGTYYEGDLSGITTGNIPFWFQHFYKPGSRISKERDWNIKLDEIVKKAKDWDIGVICGVPAWLQILLEKIIEYYKVDTIHDIWPNLTIYVHGGVSFTPYQKGFEKLLSKPLTYIETYLASEGFVAYQSYPNAKGMDLVLDNGIFFEFVPFNSTNFDEENNLLSDAQVLTIEEVELGKEYALLLSTVSGAWRYLIGDTIKFVDINKHEIVITGRTKFFLNNCGEHLSQDNMNRAIELASEKLHVDIREFSVAAVKYDNMFAHKWFIGSDDDINIDLLKGEIDGNLKKLNDDYRVERIAAIKDIIIERYPVKVFYDYMKLIGKEGSQNKFPRVLKGERLNDWEEYLRDK